MQMRFKQGNSRRRGKRIDPASRVASRENFSSARINCRKTIPTGGLIDRRVWRLPPFSPARLFACFLLDFLRRKIFPHSLHTDSSARLWKTHYLLSDIDYTRCAFASDLGCIMDHVTDNDLGLLRYALQLLRKTGAECLLKSWENSVKKFSDLSNIFIKNSK